MNPLSYMLSPYLTFESEMDRQLTTLSQYMHVVLVNIESQKSSRSPTSHMYKKTDVMVWYFVNRRA